VDFQPDYCFKFHGSVLNLTSRNDGKNSRKQS